MTAHAQLDSRLDGRSPRTTPRLRMPVAISVAVSVCATVTITASQAPTTAEAASPSPTCTAVVGTWSLPRLARQTLVVPVEETQVQTVSSEVASGVGGVILFGSTAPPHLAAQLGALLARAPHGIVPVVMTDEEGGVVQRMPNLVGSMPSPRQMARTMTTRQVRRLAHRVGARMRRAHVTMNLAPVLDLDNRPGPDATNPDGTRSFSNDAATATAYGLAFARGMAAAGVVPVVKHFPGLGHATTNTDVAPAWTRPWSTLQRHGLRPFTAAVRAGLLAVMVTTARVPGLTRLPAALSAKVVRRELRTRLGFHGLVVTDSLTGGAVSGAGYSLRRAAVRALQVGADMILFNASPGDLRAVTDRTVAAIVAAAKRGELPLGRLRRAAAHVLAAKDSPVCR